MPEFGPEDLPDEYAGLSDEDEFGPRTPQFLDGHRLENGRLESYAWPGGYPLYYITADMGVLCPDCANKNLELVIDPDDKQWYIVAAEVNYEDEGLSCDNCGEQIEAAYVDGLG